MRVGTAAISIAAVIYEFTLEKLCLAFPEVARLDLHFSKSIIDDDQDFWENFCGLIKHKLTFFIELYDLLDVF